MEALKKPVFSRAVTWRGWDPYRWRIDPLSGSITAAADGEGASWTTFQDIPSGHDGMICSVFMELQRIGIQNLTQWGYNYTVLWWISSWDELGKTKIYQQTGVICSGLWFDWRSWCRLIIALQGARVAMDSHHMFIGTWLRKRIAPCWVGWLIGDWS